MAIDLGSGNTARYYSIPDHADFTLPNADWAWITLVYPQSSTDVKYIVSTGLYGAAGAFNLILYNNTGLGVRVDTLTELTFTTPITLDKWHWFYGARRSGNLYTGIVPVGSTSVAESSPLAISASYNSSTGPNIGRRADGVTSRSWKGRFGQVAFVSGSGITTAQAAELAQGAPLLSMPFASQIKFLLHGRTASATITDLIGGHVATRQDTGYGTAEEDIQTPYIWAPEYVRGAVSSTNHTLTVDPFSLELTGSDASLEYNRVLSADSASLSFDVADATLMRGRTLAADPVSLDFSVTDAALKYNRVLQADSATIGFTGADASLEYSRALQADPAALSFNVADATLTYTQPGNYVLTAEPATLGFAVADASLKYDRKFAAEPAELAFNGSDASLRYARAIIAEAAQIAFNVADATLTRTGGAQPITSIVERTATFRRSKSVTLRFN